MNPKHLFLLIFLFLPIHNQTNLLASNPTKLWKKCHLENKLSKNIFVMAMTGYQQIDSLKNKNVISIIDFTKPSTEKRFFVIDLKRKKVLFNSLVAHGKNSGENYATSFSNKQESKKSSLGFFMTAETYEGDHGYSLRLDGLEKDINDSARTRSIVMHSASYVSSQFINENGRLGRSWGCPALPEKLSKDIIDYIAGGSCLFIYADDKTYIQKSTLIRKVR